MMTLETIAEKLSLKCKCCWENLNREVTGGYAGDLLSDVMANSEGGDIWVTRQVHQNIVAVAVLKEISCIIITCGNQPDAATCQKADEEEIPLFLSDQSAFDLATALALLQGD